GRYGRHGRDRLDAAARALQRLADECPPELQRRVGLQRLRAELLLYLGRAGEALDLLNGAGDAGIYWVEGEVSWALVEARCLRALGQPAEAAAAARPRSSWLGRAKTVKS
ncbi:MAG TPA: hypothetical protein VEJ84_20365, partial [Acidimicrobiales bacterium]|nr:hypothetical protein [Acidimicrobiales bacterium]